MTSDRQVIEAFQRTLIEDEERDREAKEAILTALAHQDAYAFSDAIEGLYYTNAWRPAFLAIRRNADPGRSFRAEMGGVWALHGSMIRNGLNDDLLLADCLRRLLPPFEGQDMTLFRGEGANNRRRRTYGMCWSSSEPVARSFALEAARDYSKGSVLLEAAVPKLAIVASVHDLDPENGEFEYLVDRRLLKHQAIRVIERLPHRPRPQLRLSDFTAG